MFRAYLPETCRAKETSINYIAASSWHFTCTSAEHNVMKLGIGDRSCPLLGVVTNSMEHSPSLQANEC